MAAVAQAWLAACMGMAWVAVCMGMALVAVCMIGMAWPGAWHGMIAMHTARHGMVAACMAWAVFQSGLAHAMICSAIS